MDDSIKKLKEINDLYQKALAELEKNDNSIESLGNILTTLMTDLRRMFQGGGIDEGQKK